MGAACDDDDTAGVVRLLCLFIFTLLKSGFKSPSVKKPAEEFDNEGAHFLICSYIFIFICLFGAPYCGLVCFPSEI